MTMLERLSDAELARIQARCDAATAGPWTASIEGRDHESGSDFIQTAGDDIELIGATVGDHDFIASARQDVPRLLAELQHREPARDITSRAKLEAQRLLEPTGETPMSDHTNARELGKIQWPDASLGSVTIDYDAVVLRVQESNGTDRTLRAEGHIGYSLVGFWDEVIVERAEIADTHPGLEACVASIKRRQVASWPDSGNLARNARRWFALLVHLSDGAVLEIFAASLRVDP